MDEDDLDANLHLEDKDHDSSMFNGARQSTQRYTLSQSSNGNIK